MAGTLVAIVLGASSFKDWQRFGPRDSFKYSATGLVHQLIALGLQRADVLDLFDSSSPSYEQLHTISQFLQERRTFTGVIVYYVGHGAFTRSSRQYFLALRESVFDYAEQTAMLASSLARVVRDEFSGKKIFVLFDCCFSAAAVASFQSPVAMQEQTVGAFGTSLLCAASANEVALAPDNTAPTVFSGALLTALKNGVPGAGSYLTLRTLRAELRNTIRARYGTDAPVPELHSPHQTSGDVSDAEFLPNAAHVVAVVEAASIRSQPAPVSLARVQDLASQPSQASAHASGERSGRKAKSGQPGAASGFSTKQASAAEKAARGEGPRAPTIVTDAKKNKEKQSRAPVRSRTTTVSETPSRFPRVKLWISVGAPALSVVLAIWQVRPYTLGVPFKTLVTFPAPITANAKASPQSWDYGFSSLEHLTSVAGRKFVVTDVKLFLDVDCAPDGLNIDVWAFFGPTEFGFAPGQVERGPYPGYLLTDLINAGRPTPPTQLKLGIGGTHCPHPVFAEYDFPTRGTRATPAPLKPKESFNPAMELTDGLYTQLLIWTGDPTFKVRVRSVRMEIEGTLTKRWWWDT
jgi:hypothetical protein